MAWVSVAGIVVSAGVAAYNGYKSRKQQREQYSQLQADAAKNPEGIFGTKPDFQAPEYNPLYQSDPGYRQIVADAISGDQQNLPAAADLTAGINKAISKQALDRIQGWDPQFMGQLNTLSQTTNATLQGQLPYEDALGIAGNRGRLANDLGMAGGSGPQIAADLGLTRTKLMTETGPGLLQGLAGIINTVDPIQRHATPQDYLLNPTAAVGMAVQENQFSATYGLQAALETATFNAMPDPQAQGQFNLQALMAGINGGSNSQSAGASTVGMLGQAMAAYGMRTNNGNANGSSLYGYNGSNLNSANGSSIYNNPYYGSGQTGATQYGTTFPADTMDAGYTTYAGG